MMSSTVAVCYFLAVMSMVTGDHVREMVIAKGPTKFAWNNCKTSAPLPLTFTSFSLSPDPIKLGTNVQVSLEAQLTEDIGKDNKLKIDADLKLDTPGGQFDVCDFIQNCHLPDFCSVIKQFKNKCPDVIKKLVPNCECPLKKGPYSVTKATIPLPPSPVEVDGVLHAKINVTESNTQIGCLELTIAIGSE